MNRRTFFQTLAGWAAAMFAPKPPAPSTAPTWSAADVVGDYPATVSVSDVIYEINNRKFWVSGKPIIYCEGGEWQDFNGYAAEDENTGYCVSTNTVIRSATFQLPAQASHDSGGGVKITSVPRA